MASIVLFRVWSYAKWQSIKEQICILLLVYSCTLQVLAIGLK